MRVRSPEGKLYEGEPIDCRELMTLHGYVPDGGGYIPPLPGTQKNEQPQPGAPFFANAREAMMGVPAARSYSDEEAQRRVAQGKPGQLPPPEEEGGKVNKRVHEQPQEPSGDPNQSTPVHGSGNGIRPDLGQSAHDLSRNPPLSQSGQATAGGDKKPKQPDASAHSHAHSESAKAKDTADADVKSGSKK